MSASLDRISGQRRAYAVSAQWTEHITLNCAWYMLRELACDRMLSGSVAKCRYDGDEQANVYDDHNFLPQLCGRNECARRARSNVD